MDQLDQDLTRFKNPAMALVGGIAAALVVANVTIGLSGEDNRHDRYRRNSIGCRTAAG